MSIPKMGYTWFFVRIKIVLLPLGLLSLRGIDTYVLPRLPAPSKLGCPNACYVVAWYSTCEEKNPVSTRSWSDPFIQMGGCNGCQNK
ncbi:hypothetical protein GGS23DRAFT_570737 [Durotheca rogersii]|uniref:uncharacterized protein n=1 Tax=Durotheca rogersii TaxID=419775 RepID=UPI00221EF75F|nr:uncharacterized protein GGS23DRAFT_570737 [Durotheca rogersii]KAI5862551.1 hypothetical protein GGS23DRAFT_570737 [Durotheca rogersii]